MPAIRSATTTRRGTSDVPPVRRTVFDFFDPAALFIFGEYSKFSACLISICRKFCRKDDYILYAPHID
jgi:hypothetical protein